MYFLLLVLFFGTVLPEKPPPSLAESKALMTSFAQSSIEKDAANDLVQSGAITPEKAENLAKLQNEEQKLAKSFDGFDAKQGANIAGAVAKGVSTGIPDLVRGFKTGNWYYLTVGTLNILTSLSVLVGGPFGSIIGSVLSIVTTLLRTFGAPGGGESQQGMIKRLLTDLQLDNLKNDVSGTEQYYRALQVTVKHLRTKPELFKLDDANLMQTLSYEHIDIFGRIKDKIGKFCYPGLVDKTNAVEKERDASRCIALLKSYVKLSVFRQLLLTEMAGLCDEATEISKTNKEGFAHMSQSFLELLKESQALDKELLQFLASPIKQIKARLAIFQLYASPGSNDVVIQYVRRLNAADQDENNQELKSVFDLEHVLFCSKEKLQGLCQNIEKPSSPSDLVTLQDWQTTRSMFIPPDLTIRGKVNKGQRVGPFYGLSVYSSEKELEKLHDIQVMDSTMSNAKMVRMCTVDDWCDVVELMAEQSLTDDNFHGISLANAKSISIPTNFKVTLISGKKKVAGPLYGKIEIKDLSQVKWDSIQIEKSETTSADKVLICDGAGFSGFCQHLDDRYQSSKPVSLSDQKTTDGKSLITVSTVASMKIPAGYQVYLFTAPGKLDRTKTMSGPFTGPMEVGERDSSTIGSIKVIKLSGQASSRATLEQDVETNGIESDVKKSKTTDQPEESHLNQTTKENFKEDGNDDSNNKPFSTDDDAINDGSSLKNKGPDDSSNKRNRKVVITTDDAAYPSSGFDQKPEVRSVNQSASPKVNKKLVEVLNKAAYQTPATTAAPPNQATSRRKVKSRKKKTHKHP